MGTQVWIPGPPATGLRLWGGFRLRSNCLIADQPVGTLGSNTSCHLERSAAESKDLRLLLEIYAIGEATFRVGDDPGASSFWTLALMTTNARYHGLAADLPPSAVIEGEQSTERPATVFAQRRSQNTEAAHPPTRNRPPHCIPDEHPPETLKAQCGTGILLILVSTQTSIFQSKFPALRYFSALIKCA
jgi:hypothetical protein